MMLDSRAPLDADASLRSSAERRLLFPWLELFIEELEASSFLGFLGTLASLLSLLFLLFDFFFLDSPEPVGGRSVLN